MISRTQTFHAVAFVENFSLKELATFFPEARVGTHELRLTVAPDGEAFLFPFGVAVFLQKTQTPGGAPLVLDPGVGFILTTMLTLTTGCVFVMWLGEQITERGVGNGISLIIFAGIVAELPAAFIQLMEMNRTQQISPLVIISLFLMAVFVIAAIVFMERAQRRLLIQYPKRQVGNRMAQGDSSHLPLKLNMAGVIPPIFASSLLLLPLTIAQFSGTGGPEWLTSVTALLGHGQFCGGPPLGDLEAIQQARQCGRNRKRRPARRSSLVFLPAAHNATGSLKLEATESQR